MDAHQGDLRRLAQTVAAWAARFDAIAAVIVFGSRVRGDHHYGSDLDLAIIYMTTASDAETEAWSVEFSNGFPLLGLPWKVDLAYSFDWLFRYPVVLSIGKVRCVHTPHDPQRARGGRDVSC